MIALNPRSVAAALGGQLAGPNTVLAPGRGHSPADRSLAVRLEPNAPDGFLTHSFAPNDDWRADRDHVRTRLGLPPWQPGDEQNRGVPDRHVIKWDLAVVDTEAAQPPQPLSAEQQARAAGAQRIWNEGQPPRGTLAETYLRQHRRLDLPDDLAFAVLRFHPHCPWRDENTGRTIRVPALIVPFRSIWNDDITGIHRIALKPDGGKIDRRMLGAISQTAVKIDPLPGDTLTIGEGIETSWPVDNSALIPHGRSAALAP
jgi:hypothetical protein